MPALLVADVIAALRSVQRNPGFVALVVPLLALALAGVLATLAIIDSVLLRPLPYGEHERLVLLGYRDAIFERAFGRQDFEDLKLRSSQIEDLAAYSYGHGYSTENARVAGQALALPVAYVSAEFFRTLRVQPALGRVLAETDAAAAQNQVGVISQALWRQAFHADPDVIGRSIEIGGAPITVVGVLPAAFDYPHRDVAVWRPLSALTTQMQWPRAYKWLELVGNLAPGATPASAERELSTILASLAKEFPHDNEGFSRGRVDRLIDVVVGGDRPWILALLAACGLLLVVAFINLGGLLLARVLERGGDIAIEHALGAPARRLARQALFASLLLVLPALLLGIAGAQGLLWALFHSGVVPLARASELAMHAPVQLFGIALAVLGAVAASLLPMLRSLRIDPLRALVAALPSPARSRSANALAVLQLALVFVLGYSALVLWSSAQRLNDVDLGGETARRVVIEFSLDDPYYQGRVVPTVQRMLGAVAAEGFVESVAVANVAPFAGIGARYGLRYGDGPNDFINADGGYTVVSPDYFRALGVPLLDGALFRGDEQADGKERPWPLLVNQAFVDQYFRGERLIGRSFRTGLGIRGEIVGVVGNLRQEGPAAAFKPALYWPYHLSGDAGPLTLIVATRGSAGDVLGDLRRVLAAAEPNLPIRRIEWLDAQIARGSFNHRLLGSALSGFAVFAGLVVALGIHAGLKLHFRARQRELAVRKAIGASETGLVGLVLRRALWLGLGGLLLGLPLCQVLITRLDPLLFEVEAFEPHLLAAGAALTLGLALLAALRPAWQARHTDAAAMLRQG